MTQLGKMRLTVEAVAYCLLAFSCSMSSAYEPSDVVKKSHQIPHLKQDLTFDNSDFGATQASSLRAFIDINKSNDYLRSLAIFPAILLAIGSILFLSLLIFWLLRYCGCMCFADRPPNAFLLRDPFAWVKAVSVRKDCLLISFFVFFSLTIAAICLSWYGYELMKEGINGLDPTLGVVSTRFQGLASSGSGLSGSASTITASLTGSTCANLQPTYAAALAAASALSSSAGDATTSVSPISTKFTDLKDIMTKYGVDYYQVGVAVVFALIAAVSIMLAIGIAIRHKTLVIANISMGLGIFILLFILCSGVTVAIMTVGDFCMAPIDNLLSTLTSETNLGTYAQYYLTCASGATDPLATSYAAITKSLSDLKNSMTSIVTACPDDAGVTAASKSLAAAGILSDAFNTFKNCPAIQGPLIGTFEEICVKPFDGFFGVWICFFVALPCLYAMVAVTSVLYEYFDPKFWEAKAANAHLMTYQDNEKEVDTVAEHNEGHAVAVSGAHAHAHGDDDRDIEQNL